MRGKASKKVALDALPAPLKEAVKVAKQEGLTDLKVIEGRPIFGGTVKTYRPLKLTFEDENGTRMVVVDKDIRSFIELTAPLPVGDIFARIERASFYDYSFSIKDYYQVRVQVSLCRDGLSLSIRLLTYHIPDISETRVPKEVVQLFNMRKPGLVLHTGGTSTGKSTTIASEVDYIAKRMDGVILTFENPVEYRYVGTRAIVQQYEVPLDIETYEDAISLALRADPSVIVFGEVRSKQEIEALVDLANRGHLVISTLHTANVEQTVEFFINLLGKEGASLFANNLLAIVSHFLYYNPQKKKLIPVHDYLVPNRDAIRKQIAEGNIQSLREQRGVMYSKGRASGYPYSRTFEEHLKELLAKGEISEEEFKSIYARIKGVIA